MKRKILSLLFGMMLTGHAGQTVIIKGALDEKDPISDKDFFEVQRLPLEAGDFLVLLLISPNSYPTLHHRFTATGDKPGDTWQWCSGSAGFLGGTEPKRFKATPDKGDAVAFSLHAPYPSLIMACDKSGILELKLSCGKASPFFYILGKDKLKPVSKMVARETLKLDAPVFETGFKYRDEVLPAVQSKGFMFRIRDLSSKDETGPTHRLVTPGGGTIFSTLSPDSATPPMFIARAMGEYRVRIQMDGQRKTEMPYEVEFCELPDLQGMLGMVEER